MYLEIDEGFPEHPKTLQLCASMQSATAFAYLINLWKWACRCCPDGDLRGISVYAIEEAARYYQHDGKLFQSMAAKLGAKSGFIDVDDSGAPVRIHNWKIRTGSAIKRMEEEAERKRLYRAHKDKKCTPGCKWCESEGKTESSVRKMSAGHPQDIPTQTSPVQTSQDQSSPDKTSQDPDQNTNKAPQGGQLVLVGESSKKAKAKKGEPTEGFLRFWDAYPLKKAKGQALKAWPGDHLIEQIIAALEWQSPLMRQQMTIDASKVKHPATWLNALCWEDEKPQATGSLFARTAPRDVRHGMIRAEDCKHEQSGEVKL